jgi:hypothetical protein
MNISEFIMMDVSQLINEVYGGSVVLPDFQRSFIWEPENIRELLVSVLSGYFIGSMLVLSSSKTDSPFALRLIEGVKEINRSAKIQSTVKILLDGQQRTTALFYALYEPDMPLKNRKSSYRFYLDLEKALKKEWDDAVIAVSRRDKRKLNEIEKNSNIIPFSLLKNIGELAKKFREHHQFDDIIELVNSFMNRKIHVVSLSKETDVEIIVETFERINRTGEPLTVFELLTARLYKNKIKLRELLETTKEKYNFAEFAPPEFILKVIALLRGKEPKRKNILELHPQNFVKDWERACNSLEAAYKRVTDIKNGYGVLDFKKWMPYTTMLVPLAAAIDFIKNKKLETKRNFDKIDRWYWTAVFSNRYDQAVDTTSANDFNALKNWIINNSKIPDFIQKFDPNIVDLDTDKQSSAIYRGVISLIVLNGALDFKTGQPPQFDKEKIQDDHIFPKSVYKEDRIVNRTLISTNAEKSDKKPSEYFKHKLKEHGPEKLRMILESHIIPWDALDCLLNDDLKGFVEKRRQAIISNLQRKIGFGNS